MTVIRKEKYIILAAQDFRWPRSRWPVATRWLLSTARAGKSSIRTSSTIPQGFEVIGFIKKSQDEKIGIPCLKQRAERELSTKFKAKLITSLSPT